MGEDLFDFLDTDIDRYLEDMIKGLGSQDPFPFAPEVELPLIPALPEMFELSDSTVNGLYTVETRSVAGRNGVWYQHAVWDNFGKRDETGIGRRADILFYSESVDSALCWHFKALKYLTESGL